MNQDGLYLTGILKPNLTVFVMVITLKTDKANHFMKIITALPESGVTKVIQEAIDEMIIGT